VCVCVTVCVRERECARESVCVGVFGVCVAPWMSIHLLASIVSDVLVGGWEAREREREREGGRGERERGLNIALIEPE
jgi:hypothetical protein